MLTCKARNRDLVSLHCAAQSLQGFVTTRLMTTTVVVALLTGLVLSVL